MLALTLSLAIAVIYLALIRVLDMNEREPLWAVLLLFGAGAAGAALVRLFIPSFTIELTLLHGAAAEEAAVFAAIILGLFLVQLAARSRGWSELNDVMDGIVYGAAAGLGYATGGTFLRELVLRSAPPNVYARPWLSLLGAAALTGLAHGVFGALSGVGVAAAFEYRGLLRRLLPPAAGLLLAVLANTGYRWLSWNGQGGLAVLRSSLALALPLLLLVAVGLYTLRSEKRAIVEQLAGEDGPDGAATARDLELLAAHGQRARLYLSTMMRHGLTRSVQLRGLHNCQVQLALTKRRAAGETNAGARSALTREMDALRGAIRERRRAIEGVTAAASTPGRP